MRIGLIARADSTGLGIQSKEFFDHIPCKALVIDMTNMSDSPIIKPNPDKFPGCTVYKMPKGFRLTGGIPEHILKEFIRDIDILFTMETAYDYNVYKLCRKRGIKTILQLNYEFLDFPNDQIPQPDLFAAPSKWYWDGIPEPKVFLPFPVDTTKFQVTRKPKTFVHIAGRPAYNDRNGTNTIAESLRYLRSNPEIIIHSQQPINFRIRNRNLRVSLTTNNKPNYWENYGGGVLILPRKFGGQSLPMNEALASGMPIITTAISPNDKWLPEEWMVKSFAQGVLHCKKKCTMFEADPRRLAQKIDQFCEQDFYEQAVQKAIDLGKSISWDTLLPKYHETFNNL
jgi:glycosyltransferase involved in cell wall biosynthesis